MPSPLDGPAGGSRSAFGQPGTPAAGTGERDGPGRGAGQRTGGGQGACSEVSTSLFLGAKWQHSLRTLTAGACTGALPGPPQTRIGALHTPHTRTVKGNALQRPPSMRLARTHTKTHARMNTYYSAIPTTIWPTTIPYTQLSLPPPRRSRLATRVRATACGCRVGGGWGPEGGRGCNKATEGSASPLAVQRAGAGERLPVARLPTRQHAARAPSAAAVRPGRAAAGCRCSWSTQRRWQRRWQRRRLGQRQQRGGAGAGVGEAQGRGGCGDRTRPRQGGSRRSRAP